MLDKEFGENRSKPINFRRTWIFYYFLSWQQILRIWYIHEASLVRMPKSSNILPQRKNFVQLVRGQYGNFDFKTFLLRYFYIVFFALLLTYGNKLIFCHPPYIFIFLTFSSIYYCLHLRFRIIFSRYLWTAELKSEVKIFNFRKLKSVDKFFLFRIPRFESTIFSLAIKKILPQFRTLWYKKPQGPQVFKKKKKNNRLLGFMLI